MTSMHRQPTRCSRLPARRRESIDRLYGEIKKALSDPDVQQKLRAAGVQPGAGSPEDISKMLARRIPQWAEVITSAGIKID